MILSVDTLIRSAETTMPPLEGAAISSSEDASGHPTVRKARFIGPFDTGLTREVAYPLTKPGEIGYVTKKCSYKGKSMHFVVWVRGRWPLRKLWSRCTGFLVLDEKGLPITDITLYSEFFKAFATWEEAYLRPVVVQSLTKKVLELKARILRVLTELNRDVRLKEPRRELDRQILSMHKTLTESEESISPLLEKEQWTIARTHNLMLKISEDGDLVREELLDELSSLYYMEDSLSSMLNKRAQHYEYWLDLLEAKGVRLRYSHSGAILTVISSSVSAVVMGTPTPLSLISLPFLRYILDALSGVRSLRREARNHMNLATRIRGYMPNLSPDFDNNLARFPSSVGCRP